MNAREALEKINRKEKVVFRGVEYLPTAIITRIGRSDYKISGDVPSELWYQVELMDLKSAAHSVVIASLSEIQ